MDPLATLPVSRLEKRGMPERGIPAGPLHQMMLDVQDPEDIEAPSSATPLGDVPDPR